MHLPSHVSKKNFFLNYWAPVVLYAIGIIYLSSQSDPDKHLPTFMFPLNDKIVHGLEYGILGILLYRAFRQMVPMLKGIGLAIICVVAFGISDEIHQWFVPRRQADVWDLLADTVGAAFLILGWVMVTEKRWISRSPLQ